MFATKPHESALRATLTEQIDRVNRSARQKINGINDLDQLRNVFFRANSP
jgi:hypothetical protein